MVWLLLMIAGRCQGVRKWGNTGTFIYLHSCYIYSLVSRSEPMVKHLYAKDRKAANQFPLRAAGMRVSGCFCVRSHDVQLSSTFFGKNSRHDRAAMWCCTVWCEPCDGSSKRSNLKDVRACE
jgi:hypothetical protein